MLAHVSGVGERGVLAIAPGSIPSPRTPSHHCSIGGRVSICCFCITAEDAQGDSPRMPARERKPLEIVEHRRGAASVDSSIPSA